MVYKFSVKHIPYEPARTIKHFCQICNAPIEKESYFYYIINMSEEGIAINRWTCSISCAELLCLCNGDINYEGYEFTDIEP